MSSRVWTLGEIAAVVGGAVVGDPDVRTTVVSTDSRSLQPGSLFVAIRGERHDGHAYVSHAMAAGAAAVLVDAEWGADAVPRVEVADTIEALRDLAAKRRSELRMPVVAVTGSTGKTSTKDLLVAALPHAFGSPRSFNNEIGVPLTVLAAPEDADHLVLEVGSRGAGHIAWLGPVVAPDVAVVTNLGVVHLETFGTTDVLADAKFELIALLEDGGVAVIPADEPRLHRSHRGGEIRFGVESGDVSVADVTSDESGRPSFRLSTPAGERRVTLPLAGAHQAVNAAAATAAALAVGVDLDTIVAGLSRASGSAWRMEIHRGRFTVVNDAYNANPHSMESALRTVAAMPGRHLAVVGEMAELGAVRDDEHRRIGDLAAALDFAAVIVVGPDHGLAEAAGSIAYRVSTPDEALAAVRDIVTAGDTVLVKASRAVGLESVALRLAEEAAS